MNKEKALIESSKLGLTKVVRALLGAGADVHARNDEALSWASDKGRVEVVKVLEEYTRK